MIVAKYLGGGGAADPSIYSLYHKYFFMLNHVISQM